MRILSYAVMAALPVTAACVAEAEDDLVDLGAISDGKNDAPEVRDVAITVNKRSTAAPGVRNYQVRSTVDFEVSLAYDTDHLVRLIVTNQETGAKFESPVEARPRVRVAGTGSEDAFKIRIENHTPATLKARLTAIGTTAVSPELVAAARANLDRVAREIDATHLQNYGFQGSLTDQFMSALAAEYETQHPDQFVARVKALGSMIFFAMPEVMPPADGHKTPFHGLDMDQMDVLMNIEDQVFNKLVALNNNNTNGVRPFSVCETKHIIESYVRPKKPFPGFDQYKADYTTFAQTCPQKDKDEWYNFRGLGHLRPSWIESNLADRFLRRMAKNCRNPQGAWATECTSWTADRLGYRQLRNRQLSARTMFYAPADEAYLIDPDNALVFLEDRNGDNVGEFLRPGPIKLASGEMGVLQINSTGEFTGNLKFQNASGSVRTVKPQELVAEDTVDARWDKALLTKPDLGLMTVFADGTGCTGASIDPAQCPLMRRFYSLIDRHENFYHTYSALTPDYYGISSQPSPLVACSITLTAAHHWDSAGIPAGGTAGFIFLMRIPFKDILTGNDVSVSTLMPGPKTTSIQSLYAGSGRMDFNSLWLDIASLSNNLYESEHEISAFGAVRADQIEGILVVRKPAAVQ